MGVECSGCSPCSTIANCCCQLFRQCASILTPSLAWRTTQQWLFVYWVSAWNQFLISPPQTDLISLFIHVEAEKQPTISIMLIYASLENNWCLENSEPLTVRTARESGHAHIVGLHYERIGFQHASSAVELPLYPFKITQSYEMLNTSGRWRLMYCYCVTIIYRVHRNILQSTLRLCLCNRLYSQ